MRWWMPVVAVAAFGQALSFAADSQPTTRSARQMAHWLADLADPVPSKRAEARRGLMQMTPADLETFTDVVKVARPLLPAQANALREVVTHVYLRESVYQSDNLSGWLGIRMQQVSAPVEVGRTASAMGNVNVLAPQNFDPVGRRGGGIMIVDRFPGFVGFGTLQEGDIIVAVQTDAQTQVLVRDTDDFQSFVRQLRAGQSITMVVLRDGRLSTQTMKLDPRPIAADGLTIEPLLTARQKDANSYWQRNFAPIIRPKVG